MKTQAPPGEPARSLADALKLVATDLARQDPPPFETLWPAAALDRTPVAAGTAAAASHRRGGGGGWSPRWLLAGCLGMLVISLALTLQPWSSRPSAPAALDPALAMAELAPGGFVPVASAERWAQAGNDISRGWLVRTELPAERLASLGLPYDPGRAAARVPAELLLHASGEVLAVRLLH
jgi:hypothetical protein